MNENSSKEIAKSIIDKICNDLCDRKGLGDEWYQIDIDIRDEIKLEWQQIVEKEISKG